MELFVPSLKYKTILVILDANISIFGEIPHENIKLLNKLFKNIRNPSNDLLDSYEDKDHENLLILYYLKKCETMTLNQIINNRNSEHYLWANLHQTRINNRESELIRELDSNPNSFFKSYTVNNAFQVKTEKDKYFRILADVKVDGRDLKEILLKNDLAYEYDGGTKKQKNWCNRGIASKK